MGLRPQQTEERDGSLFPICSMVRNASERWFERCTYLVCLTEYLQSLVNKLESRGRLKGREILSWRALAAGTGDCFLEVEQAAEKLLSVCEKEPSHVIG